MYYFEEFGVSLLPYCNDLVFYVSCTLWLTHKKTISAHLYPALAVSCIGAVSAIALLEARISTDSEDHRLLCLPDDLLFACLYQLQTVYRVLP